jgi:hydrophobic/amphiphilic exporter-1 (mainly G- bacteria), HAE1 family
MLRLLHHVYQNPLRVYLIFLGLMALGTFYAWRIPLSLYPNTERPVIFVDIPYFNQTPQEFLELVGSNLESRLMRLDAAGHRVERVRALYEANRLSFEVYWSWQTPQHIASQRVHDTVSSMTNRWAPKAPSPFDLSYNVSELGYFAAAIKIPGLSLTDTKKRLEPILLPDIYDMEQVEDVSLWSPAEEEVRIELKPDALIHSGIDPALIETAIKHGTQSERGGRFLEQGETFQIYMPPDLCSLDSLRQLPIKSRNSHSFPLKDLAYVDMRPKSGQRTSFLTGHDTNLVLYVKPKLESNLKALSEKLHKHLEHIQQRIPMMRVKTLVNPSQLITRATETVVWSMLIGTLLSLLVLFLGFRSFRQTLVSLLEIPISTCLTLFMMSLSGTNFNLITLGGLALSAGLNIHTTIWLLDRLLERLRSQALTQNNLLPYTLSALRETLKPLLLSTMVSVLILIPLFLVSRMAGAMVGDLARAVAFSHFSSILVTLLFTPTLRIQLARKGLKEGVLFYYPEASFQWFQKAYQNTLKRLIRTPKLHVSLLLLFVSFSILLLEHVWNHAPRELVAAPRSNMIELFLQARIEGSLSSMEDRVRLLQHQLQEKWGPRVRGVTAKVQPQLALLFLELDHASHVESTLLEIEASLQEDPDCIISARAWTPGSSGLSQEPLLRLTFRGGSRIDRRDAIADFLNKMEPEKLLPLLHVSPSFDRRRALFFTPRPFLHEQDPQLPTKEALAHWLEIASKGRKIGEMLIQQEPHEIVLHYPEGFERSIETYRNLPITIDEKRVPLRAFYDIALKEIDPPILRENMQELAYVELGSLYLESGRTYTRTLIEDVEKLLKDWKQTEMGRDAKRAGVVSQIELGKLETQRAFDQLSKCFWVSIVLLVASLLLYFAEVQATLAVLMSGAFGFTGALLGLWISQSPLSIHSGLGMIILNGFCISNSIHLVETMRQLQARNLHPYQLALYAVKARFRPIFLTTCATTFGLLPLACGWGEAGNILQPLGIVVSGGLLFSVLLTLFWVPLSYSYLRKTRV